MEIGPIAGISTIRLERTAKLNQNVRPTSLVEATKEVDDRYQPGGDRHPQEDNRTKNIDPVENDDSDEGRNWTALPYGKNAFTRGAGREKISYFV